MSTGRCAGVATSSTGATGSSVRAASGSAAPALATASSGTGFDGVAFSGASDGPPRVSLTVPQVPVSRFDLSLPGKKELEGGVDLMGIKLG